MILIIDNYDSFVHNLVRYVSEIGYERTVVRNDKITVSEIRKMKPDAIILSPGPCAPDDAGVCLDVIRKLGATMPILGVCLGHQCIGQAYGGRVICADRPVHGNVSYIRHNEEGIFKGLAQPLKVARYHSLVVETPLPPALKATAHAEDGTLMAFEHVKHPVVGVQFHPESVLTDQGRDLLKNFITRKTAAKEIRRHG